MSDALFLGTGAKFPFEVNPATGRIEVSHGAQNVKESLFIALKTALGERPFRPGFGTNLNAYTFADINPTTLQMLKRELSMQVYESEPRISGIDLEVDTSQEGTILFNISYTVTDSNVTENLVFPFFLTGEGIAPPEAEEEPEIYDIDDILDELEEEYD